MSNINDVLIPLISIFFFNFRHYEVLAFYYKLLNKKTSSRWAHALAGGEKGSHWFLVYWFLLSTPRLLHFLNNFKCNKNKSINLFVLQLEEKNTDVW